MILITGGLGFIGLNTASALLDLGEACVLAQRRDAACPPELAGHLGRRLFLERVDVTDPAALLAVGERHAVTGIVHLAGPGLAPDDPVAAVREHAIGLTSVFEAAQRWEVRRLTLASSIGVYAGASADAWREDAPLPMTARFPMEAMKKSTEVLSTYLAGALDMSVAVLRIGAVWGPFGRPESRFFALPRLVNAAVRGERPYPPGTAVHAGDGLDSLYARDCGRAVALVQTVPALGHAVYNIGSGRVTTNAEVAAAIAAVVPGADLPLADGRRPDQPPSLPLDVTRLSQDTGFAPAYPIDRAVADYVAWLRGRA